MLDFLRKEINFIEKFNDKKFCLSFWNNIFEKLWAYSNQVLEWWEKLIKEKWHEWLKIIWEFEHKINWSSHSYYNWKITIHYFDSHIMTISSKEPVYWLDRSSNLSSPEAYSVIKHKWKFEYNYNINKDNLKMLHDNALHLYNYILLLWKIY